MVSLHYFQPGARWLDWPWRWTGVAPVAFGFIVAIGVNLQFRRHGTTIKPFEESSALVTGGPFRVSRNPIYVGMTVALMGLGVLLGSVTPFLVVPLFVWWIDKQFIRVEEQALTETFGEEYTEYQSNVRRWL
jgi:protein-S-isoprenylcysteine O-methyltransferase Ste14